MSAQNIYSSAYPISADAMSVSHSTQQETDSRPVLFVGGLPIFVTEQLLTTYMSAFGHVMSVVVAKRATLSKGYAYVTFESRAAADAAVAARHFLEGQEFACSYNVCKKDWMSRIMEEKNRKVFLLGISDSLQARDIAGFFEPFGPVERVTLNKHANGKRKGSAFILFHHLDDALKLLKLSPNKVMINGREVKIFASLTKREVDQRNRNAQLPQAFEKEVSSKIQASTKNDLLPTSKGFGVDTVNHIDFDFNKKQRYYEADSSLGGKSTKSNHRYLDGGQESQSYCLSNNLAASTLNSSIKPFLQVQSKQGRNLEDASQASKAHHRVCFECGSLTASPSVMFKLLPSRPALFNPSIKDYQCQSCLSNQCLRNENVSATSNLRFNISASANLK